ncbi:hypothetical protein K457DRAFT_575717 [Linnemannia elongata AG-77]|uniref:Uncharacterized protein n=1 Tax=Linnemannia elongata AG-77 TaxID=1314771 RepID=A0A197KE08_9FUNG|nr:hypothetical protein K457DRAFT_575717 [Linnemannia elongata AG-77]
MCARWLSLCLSTVFSLFPYTTYLHSLVPLELSLGERIGKGQQTIRPRGKPFLCLLFDPFFFMGQGKQAQYAEQKPFFFLVVIDHHPSFFLSSASFTRTTRTTTVTTTTSST